MFRFSLLRSYVPVALSLCLVAALVACKPPSPAEDPTIKKTIETVDNLELSVGRLQTNCDTLGGDLDVINSEVANLKQSGPGSNADVNKVLARQAAQDKVLLQMSKELDALKKDVAALEARKPAPTPKAKGSSRDSGKGSRSTPSVKPAPTPTPTPPKGAYYKVQAGDTIESIAQAKGVTATAVRRANRLPSTVSRLGVGATIFVPAP